jgi:hypothetical protein
MLTIYGTGKGKVILAAGAVSLQAPDGKASASLHVGVDSSLHLTDGQGAAVSLIVSKASPSLAMVGVDGAASLSIIGPPALSLTGAGGLSSVLNRDALLFIGGEDGDVSLGVRHGPGLALTDGQGFHSVLGVTKTVSTGTGEHHQTSAAALTMFDKEGKVIWSAP